MNKFKKCLKIILCLFIFIILLVGGYGGYILLSYKRVGNLDLEVKGLAINETLNVNTKYKALTYNIGFGAYSQDFTFFLDSGYDKDGNPTCGYNSTAKSKEDVLFNVNGVIDVIDDLDPDFVLLQEVDVNSTRSYKVNERDLIVSNFNDYNYVHAQNMHTAFLPYPLYDMHGKVDAGMTSLAKFKINNASRKEYTITKSLAKLFDLDRCFSVMEFSVDNGKKLFMINNHMSAYDKGGVIREKQMQELNDFTKACYASGDYVIVGGDFNHDLLTYNPNFNYTKENKPFNETKKDPDWVKPFFNEDGSTFNNYFEDFFVAASDNHPSCRNNDIPYVEGETYVLQVDGFLVSKNIEVNLVETNKSVNSKTGKEGFAFSDHEGVILEFTLK